VAQQEDREAGMARDREIDQAGQVFDIVVDGFDKEALTVRPAATAKVERVDGVAFRDQALGSPDVLAAVRIDPVADGDDRLGGGWPAARSARRCAGPALPGCILP